MTDPSRDIALVEQVLAGHKQVFAELVDLHKVKIYSLLRGMGAGHQDAQDYTQEAFLKAYRKLASYRKESSFASWLYTIAVHVFTDAGRRKRVNLSSSEDTKTSPQEKDTPESVHLRKETESEIAEILSELPERYRLVLLLRYTNELSYEEIGEMTGLTSNQVRNRLHRAKKSLHKRLKNKEGISREMLSACSDGRG